MFMGLIEHWILSHTDKYNNAQAIMNTAHMYVYFHNCYLSSVAQLRIYA